VHRSAIDSSASGDSDITDCYECHAHDATPAVQASHDKPDNSRHITLAVPFCAWHLTVVSLSDFRPVEQHS
jgi:hypothetical protein